jgi:hypothetical protein
MSGMRKQSRSSGSGGVELAKPRTVRNFWIKAVVDSNSRKNRNFSFGPGTATDDGFNLEVYMRQNKDVIVPVQMAGYFTGQKLVLQVQLGLDTHILETER